MSRIVDKFHPLLDPQSIAFVGASNSPGKWGNIVFKNIINGGFRGNIYPINPKEKEILGKTAYSNIKDLPEIPDLAVLLVPHQATLTAIEECVNKGVRAGLIITAGFAEVGYKGKLLQDEIVKKAKEGGMILVGPNCNGLIRPSKKLFPEMPSVFPSAGALGIVSQSGNVAMSMGRRSIVTGIGVSTVISSGNEADLHCEDMIEFLAEDSETEVIACYIEGFKDTRRFLTVAKEVSKKKPIVILKAGETPAGARAALSHTAALAGSSAVFDGACHQTGMIRVHSIDDLFNTSIGFLNQPIASGNRTAILTTGGGFGVLAADVCSNYGLEIVDLSNSTVSALAKNLPPWWNPGNPVDMLAGNSEGAIIKSLEILLNADETDCILMMGVSGLSKTGPLPYTASDKEAETHAQQTIEHLTTALKEIREMSHHYKKPVVTATELPFTSGNLVEKVFYDIGKKSFAVYRSPETASIVLSNLVKYGKYFNENSE